VNAKNWKHLEGRSWGRRLVGSPAAQPFFTAVSKWRDRARRDGLPRLGRGGDTSGPSSPSDLMSESTLSGAAERLSARAARAPYAPNGRSASGPNG
jgi:hypothetical protein